MNDNPSSILSEALRWERWPVLLGLVLASVLAWGYLMILSGGMDSHGAGGSSTAAPPTFSWSLLDLTFAFLMWSVMMVAMMVPASATMILMFDAVGQKRRAANRYYVSTAVFLLAYLLIWIGFAAIATLMQWLLYERLFMTSAMGQTLPWISGSMLIGAGMYQMSTLKNVCLKKCRTALTFLMAEWREGTRGAVILGVRHGMFCLACCWSLMLLMFAVGL